MLCVAGGTICSWRLGAEATSDWVDSAGRGVRCPVRRTISTQASKSRQTTDIARTLISFFEVKTGISLTVSLDGPKSDPASSGIRKMLIELALFAAVAVAVGATIVKVYEWRQNVLYGLYVLRPFLLLLPSRSCSPS